MLVSEYCSMSPRQVFLREATGLVRQFGPFDAFVLAVGNIVGPWWITFFLAEWLTFPGVSVPMSFVLTAPLAAIHGVYYVMITSAMPRSGGGGYVPLSRVIHPILGIGMGFVFVLGYIECFAFAVLQLIVYRVSGPLAVIGTITTNSGLQSVGTLVATPGWAVTIGTIFIALAGAVQIFGPQKVALINKISFVIAVAGTLVLLGVLFSTSQTQFQLDYEKLAGAGAYANVIATAKANGWTTVTTGWLVPTLLASPLTFGSVLGYQTNCYYAGEMKRVTNTMFFSVIFSILFNMFFFGGIALLMERTFGLDFITSLGYLFSAVPSAYQWSFGPYVTNLIILINSNPFVDFLVIASVAAFTYLVVVSYFIVVSRFFFAWSFDRVVPSVFGSVNEKYHSPIWAIVVTGVLVDITLAMGFCTINCGRGELGVPVSIGHLV